MLKNNPLLGNFTVNSDFMQDSKTNIPAELAIQKRFFACKSKSELPTGWNKPENQKLLADIEIDKFAGFDISGHDIADRADYLCFDFDHVLKDDGSFVNESAEKFVADLRDKFPSAYIERSISGTGLHVFFNPTADVFPKITNGSNGVLNFGDSAKLEMFYKNSSKYILLTGFKIADSGSDVPCGDRVDEYIKNLLETIQAQNKTVEMTADKSKKDFSADPPEYTRDLAVALLDYIDGSTLSDSDWLSVISSCKNCGVDETISDAWCLKVPDRYDAIENQRRYDSLTDPNFGIENLIGKAQGFDFKKFWHEWHIDNKIADMVKSHCKNNANDFTNSDTSILSARVGLVNERTDFSMGTDTTVTNSTVNSEYALSTRKVKKSNSTSNSTVNSEYALSTRKVKKSNSTSNSTVNSEHALTTRKVKKSNIKYYTAREVAKMLGVTEGAVRRWREKRIFGEDVLDHNGVYWYAAERVEQLKSVYHKGWEKIYKDNDKNSLETELLIINEELAAFDNEKTSAIALLNKSDMKFDRETMFADDFLTATAFAKLYDKKTFSNIHAEIKKNKEISLRNWLDLVKEKENEISQRHKDLLTQKNILQADVNNQNFFAQNNIDGFSMANFTVPNYSISDDGIFKVDGEKLIPVCSRPICIAEKIVYPVIKSDEILFSDETKYEFVLAHKLNGKIYKIKPEKASNIFDARNIVKLADYNLPVNTANARNVIEYLDTFKTANEKILPIKYCVPRLGWFNFNGTDIFIDSRRNFRNSADVPFEISVDSKNRTASTLTDKGSIDEIKTLFQNITLSPVAEIFLGCAVAVPLLKPLGCRNFAIHIYGTTTSGKTTLLKLAAFLVGNPDMVSSYNATKNAISRLVFDRSDYPFFVDEKQSADKNMRDSFIEIDYIVGNGQGKLRCNRDGSLQDTPVGRTIFLSNGETPLLNDNATGGAFTRLLQIQLKGKIFDKSDCEKIWALIKENHGFILPLVIGEYFKDGFEDLRETFNGFKADLAKDFPAISPIHLEFVAVGTIGLFYLLKVLGVDNNEKNLWRRVEQTAKEFVNLIPTIDDISDSKREIDCVTNFISRNQSNFAGLYSADCIKIFFGATDSDYLYITKPALKQCCDESGFDEKKLVADLIAAKFFIPADKIDKNYKTPRSTVLKKINKANARCYRIPIALLGINTENNQDTH